MNRRRFAGAALAGMGGLFFPQKSAAQGEIQQENRWGMLPIDRKEHTYTIDITSQRDKLFSFVFSAFRNLEKIPSDVFIPSDAKTNDDIGILYHTVGSVKANKKTIAILRQDEYELLGTNGKLLGTAVLIEDLSLVDGIVVLVTQDIDAQPNDLAAGESDEE